MDEGEIGFVKDEGEFRAEVGWKWCAKYYRGFVVLMLCANECKLGFDFAVKLLANKADEC